jgi:hypothetical protein
MASLRLTNDVYKSLHELLPGLHCIEVGSLMLSSSHADVDCSWQELRFRGEIAPNMRQLAWLLQRLVLPGIACVQTTEDSGDIAAVLCSSGCRLASARNTWTFRLHSTSSESLARMLAQLSAIRCPDALAAVTRCVTLRVSMRAKARRRHGPRLTQLARHTWFMCSCVMT